MFYFKMAAHLLIATNPTRQTTQHRILLVSNTCDPHIVRMLRWIWHLTDLCCIDIVFNFQISDINYTSRSLFYQFIVVQVPLWHWATFISFLHYKSSIFTSTLYCEMETYLYPWRTNSYNKWSGNNVCQFCLQMVWLSKLVPWFRALSLIAEIWNLYHSNSYNYYYKYSCGKKEAIM